MSEIEVTDFNFRQLCKLKVGDGVEHFNNRYNSLAVSNLHGLLFAVDKTDIVVLRLSDIEELSQGDITFKTAVTSYKQTRIAVGLPISSVSLSCDETTLLVVYKDGQKLHMGAIDTQVINSSEQDRQKGVYASLPLADNADVVYVRTHPDTPSLTALSLTNGHALLVELSTNGFKTVVTLNQTSPVRSMCWSPKGKRIVLGMEDGQLVQYDKILKNAKKTTACPVDLFGGSKKPVTGVFWISSFIFVAVYEENGEPPSVVVVTIPREGPPSYESFDDIYLGFNDQRLLTYYFNYIPEWKLLVSMSSISLEAAPLSHISQEKWEHWILPDCGRAEVPIGDSGEEAFAVGMQISLNSQLKIQKDDQELPAAPIFFMLCTNGTLCVYQMVNQFNGTNHAVVKPAQPMPSRLAKLGQQPLKALSSGQLNASKPSAFSSALPASTANDQELPAAPILYQMVNQFNGTNHAGTTQTSKPASGGGFSFGPSETSNEPSKPALGGFSFGPLAASKEPPKPASGGFNFGPSASIAQPQKPASGGFGFAAPAKEPQKPATNSFSFALPASTAQPQKPASGGFSFGPPATSTEPAEKPTVAFGGNALPKQPAPNMTITSSTMPSTSLYFGSTPSAKQPGVLESNPNISLGKQQSPANQPKSQSLFQSPVTDMSKKGLFAPKPTDKQQPSLVSKLPAMPQPTLGAPKTSQPVNFQLGAEAEGEQDTEILNYTAKLDDDQELPAAPILFMLCTNSTLCVYQMVNQFNGTNHAVVKPAQPIPSRLAKLGQQPLKAPSSGQLNASKPSAFSSALPASTANDQELPAAPILYQMVNQFNGTNHAGTTQTSKPASGGGFSFGPSETSNEPSKPALGGFSFGPLAASKEPPKPASGGFNFGPSASIAQPQKPASGGFGFAAPAKEPQKPATNSFSFALPASTAQPQKPASGGFSFGPPATSTEPAEKPTVAFGGNALPKQPAPNMTITSSTMPSTSLYFGSTPSAKQPGVLKSNPNISLGKQQSPANQPTSQSLFQSPVTDMSKKGLFAPKPTDKQQPSLVSKLPAMPQPTLGAPKTSQPVNFQLGAEAEGEQDTEILNYTAKLDGALQKNISEEINSFNAEMQAFLTSVSDVTSQKDLIGSEEELKEMRDNVDDLETLVNDHKNCMSENKKESSELRNEMLKIFKTLDEAILQKKKLEDKRYSYVMKFRSLDPISQQQRKVIREQYNIVTDRLTDINVALDEEWQRNEMQKRNLKNKSSNIAHTQQIYKTVEAIDQITRNLSNRINTLTLKSEESQLLAMNVSRTSDSSNLNSSQYRTNTTQNKPSQHKLSMLKSYLTKRPKTPVRKAKHYDSTYITGSNDTTLINDNTIHLPSQKLHPKAASTPAFAVSTFDKKDMSLMKAVAEEVSPMTPKLQSKTVVTKDLFTGISPAISNAVKPSQKPSNAFIPTNSSSNNTLVNQAELNKTVPFDFGKPQISATQTKPATYNQSKPAFSFTPNKNVSAPKAPSFAPTESNPADFNFKPSQDQTVSSSVVNESSDNKANLTQDKLYVAETKSFIPIGLGKSSTVDDKTNNTLKGNNANAAKFIFGDPNDKVQPRENTPQPSSGGLFGSASKETNTTLTNQSDEVSSLKTTPSSATTPASIGLFGSKTAPTSGSLFGSATSTASGGLFGSETATGSGGLSGSATTAASSGLFGLKTTTASGGLFGSATTPASSGSVTTNASGGLFGSTTSTASGGLFGSATTTASGGLFGSETTPASSGSATTTASGGLFGSTTTNASGGLFGSTTLTASGGLFGSATTTASGGLFGSATTPVSSGSATTTTSGGLFGSTTTNASGGLFGSTTSTASGGLFGSATTTASGGLFGSTTTTASGGLFGSANSTASGGLFGSTTTTASGGLFGSANSTASGGLFGSTTTTASGGLFGSTTTTASGGLFGSTTTTASGGLFGSTTSTASGGLFGSTTTTASGGLFGSTTSTASGGLFGSTTTTASGGLFGSTTTTASGGLFGSTTTTASGGLFGSTTTTASGGLFGSTTSTASGGLFGSTTTTASGGLFGSTTSTASGGLFGSTTTTASGGLFGSTTTTASGGLFGSTTTTASGGLFGSTTTTASGGLFGSANSTASGGLFGSTTTTASGGLFGSTTSTASGGLFGSTTTTASGGLFESTTTTASGGLFGSTTTTASGGLFGSANSTASGGLFGSTTTIASGGLFGSAKPSGSLFGNSGSTQPAFGKQPETASSGGFGGFGLGGKPISDPNKNPFAVAAAPSQDSSNLFGNTSTSVFGQAATKPTGGDFSSGFGTGLTAEGQSGFGTPTPVAAPAPSFGGVPGFGSPPAFGGVPAFGGSPATSTFGGEVTFGGGATFGGGGGFGGGAVFGGGAGSSFGNLASQSGSTFGSMAAATPSFGGMAQQQQANSPPPPSGSSFSEWR